ncbi:PAS domain-containing hybrid sensor histidine kinase/response regulator [uncultured Agrobacterium sp.]|uniref:PAS domain-containing hybrid sensor histidine kinase/response regulator n=1 Tax=uncultured Agrobacterium sp. TaxID=157277 RepID=UPI002583757D|nr:PAS domain-containing hybrid sensor histidine kinase/response regulator [uncultured Agrobacterium sp.]
MSDLARLKEQLTDAFGGPEGEAQSLPQNSQPAFPDVSEDQARSPSNQRLLRIFAFLSAMGALAFVLTGLLKLNAGLMALCGLTALVGLTGFAHTAWRNAVSRNRDALEARLQEEKQVRNAALMAEIHEAMGDLVVTRDMNRRIVHANGVFREVTGCAAPEGKSCEDIGIAFRPGGKLHCYDVEIATPYGQRIFSWYDIVTQDITSSRLVISSIARDVTEERAALINREEARLRAENADAAKGRLLATVSHEIRLPLSGILGMNHLLSQTRLTQEQRNYLDGMRESGQALVQLVEDLLDFSTMEAGRFRLNPRAENLRQLIESVVEMLAHRAHEKGIEIASLVAPDVPDYLDFDPARLRQVLFNLIGNAVKFTREGGVFVHASMAHGELAISVEDTGPGMSRAEQARIFGEFEQAGSARQRSNGTGLGLAISARIVREFGGALTVSSKKGKGSTFLLKFRPAIAGSSRLPSHRLDALQQSKVLLLSPAGVASAATAKAIQSLGGLCIEASTIKQLDALQAEGQLGAITDIIIDHRAASTFRKRLQTLSINQEKPPRRILLVNPEERASQPQEEFDAWLIRPLREKSLVDVLCGRLRGLERRDAINDNHPGFSFSPAIAPVREKAGCFHELTVLVAEDDPVIARIIRAVLEKSGCKVHAVDDFPALSEAISGTLPLPDLVISDLNMPGGEGLDVLPGINHALQGQGTPLFVLSADTSDATRLSLSNSGMDIVLPKPVEPKRLIEEILRLFPQTRIAEI